MRRALVTPRFAALLVASLAMAIPSVGRAQGRAGGGGNATRELPNQSTPLGPGASVRFPDDPSLVPFLGPEGGLGQTDPNAPSQITPKVLDSMRLISDTYDRSRALLDLAREAILSNQLLLAHETLKRAMTAELNEPNSLRHDQLIIESIMITSALTEALLRESRPQLSLLEPEPGAGLPEPLKKKLEPRQAIRLARLDWRRAAYVAREVVNPTYRNEYLDRVVEAMAKDSGRITEFVRPTESSEVRSEPAKLDPKDVKEYEEAADSFVVEAAELARSIERPIWRNAALARTAVAAGESGQYDRSFNVALSIENAEARSQALLLVAESECRHNKPDLATRTYSEAAEAIARVEQEGLRGVLAGFLVDSLISTGRFDDARASLVLYPTESERFVAMGAIAESEGRRGSADKARRWIASEAPAAYRSALYRRVNTGVLAAISNERQNQYSSREAPAPSGR